MSESSAGLHQALQYIVDDRAKRGVLLRKPRPPDQHIFIRIGKTFAVRRPNVVYPASVIGSQERTGRRLNHIVPVFIQTQIAVDELTFAHLQMTGYPFDVRRLESRRVILTAIRALQTIDPPERLLMQLGQPVQNLIPQRRLPRLLQEPSVFLLPA